MTAWSNFIFDLDGTLIDSAPDILACLRNLKSLQALKPDWSKLAIGPPLSEMIKVILPSINTNQLDSIIFGFRRSYEACGFPQTKTYSGVEQFLQRFNARKQVQLFIATNKPIVMTRKIIDCLKLGYFCDIISPDSNTGQTLSKGEMIARLLSKWNLVKINTLVIGDSASDIEAAHKHGVVAAAFLSGYGDKAALQAAQAEYSFDNFSQLEELILGGKR